MQGGDFQDQSLLQFFLNRVEFGMDIQQAAEAANFWSFQFRNSFDDHRSQPGVIQLSNSTPEWVIRNLQGRGYRVLLEEESVGPITAIEISQEHGTLMGATATHGDDHGIGW